MAVNNWLLLLCHGRDQRTDNATRNIRRNSPHRKLLEVLAMRANNGEERSEETDLYLAMIVEFLAIVGVVVIVTGFTIITWPL